MSSISKATQPATHSSHEQVPLRPVTLRDVISDCGGFSVVADALDMAVTTVYDWSRRGRVPDSDLKPKGGTSYSDQLAKMQREGKLSAAVIRRLGRRL